MIVRDVSINHDPHFGKGLSCIMDSDRGIVSVFLVEDFPQLERFSCVTIGKVAWRKLKGLSVCYLIPYQTNLEDYKKKETK